MSTEQEPTQQPVNKQQPKYFMIIVKDEGYTCPEERDDVTKELITPEEFLPPAANPEQWWLENNEIYDLCGGNTIIGIINLAEAEALEHINISGNECYKPNEEVL